MSHNGRFLRDSLLLCQPGLRRDFPASHGFFLSCPLPVLHVACAGNCLLCGDQWAAVHVWVWESAPLEADLVSSQEPDGQLRGWRLGGLLVGSALCGPWKYLHSYKPSFFHPSQSQLICQGQPLPGFTIGQNKQYLGKLPVRFAPEPSQEITADQDLLEDQSLPLMTRLNVEMDS